MWACSQAVGAILAQQEVPEDLKKTLIDTLGTSGDSQIQQMLSAHRTHL